MAQKGSGGGLTAEERRVTKALRGFCLVPLASAITVLLMMRLLGPPCQNSSVWRWRLL
jgi:hypothetical protein